MNIRIIQLTQHQSFSPGYHGRNKDSTSTHLEPLDENQESFEYFELAYALTEVTLRF